MVKNRSLHFTAVSKFDSIVGLSYLRGMHLNDSKTDFGSRKDRHENIGTYVPSLRVLLHILIEDMCRGYIGLNAFRHIMNDTRVQNIPLILETPSFELPVDVWGKEVAVLQQLSQITVEQKENDNALCSIIGEVRTDDALVELVMSAVKVAEARKPKKPSDVKAKKSRKRKRAEDSDEDEDEDEDG